MSGQKRVDAIVKGRVQGVGFRYFVQREATKLALRGEVKNLPNGNVRVIAEGEEPALHKLMQKLHEGPSMSHVQAVVINWENDLNQYQRFEISY